MLGESIGILQAENLGTPLHSTPAAIVARDVLAPGAAYPYLDQTTGVLVADIVQAKSYGQLGNLIVSQPLVAAALTSLLFDPRVAPLVNIGDNTGSIETLIADANNTRLTTSFEGITGPVYAEAPLATPLPNSGHITDVSIGAGILPSGNGNLAKAGLFASPVHSRPCAGGMSFSPASFSASTLSQSPRVIILRRVTRFLVDFVG